MIYLREIIDLIKEKEVESNIIFESIKIENINFNTNNIKTNGIYFALTNGKTDGHLYIEKAIENGAICCFISDTSYINKSNKNKTVFVIVKDTLKTLQNLSEKYRDQYLKSKIIAITGSNGKTTTKDILFSIINKKFKVKKTEGNFNNHLGMPITILNTSPDVDYLILEMGMNHFGEIKFLSEIANPDYSIITNIGESHVENLGSRNGIVKAKSEIRFGMRENSKLFLPKDSDKFNELWVENKEVKNKVSFGKKETESNYWYDIKERNMLKTKFKTNLFEEIFEVALFGDHNISNAIPCIAIGKTIGINFEEINQALNEMVITSMRFEKIITDKKYTLINDAYNASPTSMKASIETYINLYKNHKKVLILGDMYELGVDTLNLHSEIGNFLNKFEKEIDCLITVGEYSKSISENFNGNKKHYENKNNLKEDLFLYDKEDYSLFFKASRGMKLEEIVNNIK